MIPFFRLLLVFFYLFSTQTFAHYGSNICKKNPVLSCYKVKSKDNWEKLFPDSTERDMVMRINRMNTRLYPGLIIAIPNTTGLTMMDVSPLDPQIEPPGEKIIFVSIKDLAWGAYDPNGSLVNWGPISSAKGYCADIHRGCHTSLGEFKIYRKEGADCKSTKFPVGKGGAPMPYCMFFNGGFALHGSYNVPGYNDSHGCVRLFVKDAQWLNLEFVGDDKVPVIIRKS